VIGTTTLMAVDVLKPVATGLRASTGTMGLLVTAHMLGIPIGGPVATTTLFFSAPGRRARLLPASTGVPTGPGVAAFPRLAG
jgi:predicted MFS family arabinose efflux permease